ncbi:MAG TPA: maleylpyruvate isomerase N-terminal domain-containing protein [Thermomicrobiales bacterium]|nr:maleylpyruvate isomerase N-terminal domain-containing protein [Thermomicrobiales bacterium]
MPDKQEIIAAIQEGIERVDSTFSTLTDEQLATTVHEGDGGWTARQVLAHLAGRAKGHQMLLSMATGASPGGFAGFDVNAWNQQIVDERAGRSRDELLQEFRQTHEALIENVRELPDGAFETLIPSPRGGEVALGDMLAGSGGQHNVNHTIEVEQALGLTKE